MFTWELAVKTVFYNLLHYWSAYGSCLQYFDSLSFSLFLSMNPQKDYWEVVCVYVIENTVGDETVDVAVCYIWSGC